MPVDLKAADREIFEVSKVIGELNLVNPTNAAKEKIKFLRSTSYNPVF